MPENLTCEIKFFFIVVIFGVKYSRHVKFLRPTPMRIELEITHVYNLNITI